MEDYGYLNSERSCFWGKKGVYIIEVVFDILFFEEIMGCLNLFLWGFGLEFIRLWWIVIYLISEV